MTKRFYLVLLSLIVNFLLLFLSSNISLASNEITGNWNSSLSLPYQSSSHASIGFNNKLYILGGATNDDYSNVLKSTVNESGVIYEWILDSNSLPDTRYWSALASKGNNVYVLGGSKWTGFQTDVNTVFSSTIDDEGNFSDWQTLNPMPGTRAFGNSVIVNNRIYYAGGFNGSTRFADIFYTDIKPDGTLGTWTTSSISLPYVLQGFGMVSSGNYIFVIGGESNNISQSEVYSSLVNPDGSLNPWQETENLPQPLYRSSYIQDGDRLISIGGQNGSSVSKKVYYTEINDDGTIGVWQESANELPIPVTGASVAKVGDYLYLTGGWNTVGYLDTVFYTKLNKIINLPVTPLKQTSSPWNDDVYDLANLWASDSSFSRWGCAVTSAAMVFNYHGLTKMDDNSNLDPGTLNEWLKSQPDGYVRNGLTNWLALSRLSKQISESNSVEFEALEFEKIFTSDSQIVKENIDAGNPDILREPGHFVVARGYDSETIYINDPYHPRSDLSEYANTFGNISRFTPSSTDLSYIMLVIDENVEIKVFDKNGNEIGEQIIEEPIIDPAGSSETNAQPLKTVYIKKPESGNYKIEISGTGEYELNSYLYDEFGNVKQFIFEETVNGDSDYYSLSFSKTNSDESIMADVVTYQTLLRDIFFFYNNKEIKIKK